MRTGFARVVVLSVAALAPGCGGGGSSGGASIPIDQLGDELAAAYCHKMLMCCNASELASMNATTLDEAGCRAYMADFFAGKVTVTQADVDAGRVVYHGDRARACIDRVAALACPQWVADDRLLRFAECQTIVEGTLATGAACTTGDQCSSGHCGDSTGALVCTAPAQLGDSCDFARCVPGLACRTDASAAPRMCGQPLADGAACADSQDCASSFCITATGGQAFCGLPPFCDGI